MVYFVLTPRRFAYRHAATTFLLAAEGFRGGNMRGSRDFCQPYLVLGLFTVYRGGPMVLLLRKLYLYVTKDPEEVHYFPGGGGIFSGGGGGVQMLIS